MKKRATTAVRPQLPRSDEELRQALGAEDGVGEETLAESPTHHRPAEEDPRWATWTLHVSP